MPAQSPLCPQVSLGGSSFDDLYDKHAQAAEALRAAIKSLPEPHPRDYLLRYDDWAQVQNEHRARVLKLTEVLKEMEFILESISDQERAPAP